MAPIITSMSSTRLPVDSLAAPISQAPDWVIAEMPPGYHNRLDEIRRLTEDLRALDSFARLLWANGTPLTEAVRDAFVALQFDAAIMPGHTSDISVRLNGRRLLVHVVPTPEVIRKKSADLARVFQLLHESAEDGDRVVLVSNAAPATQ